MDSPFRRVAVSMFVSACVGLPVACFDPDEPGGGAETESGTGSTSTTATTAPTSSTSPTGPTTTVPSTTDPSTTEPSTTTPTTTDVTGPTEPATTTPPDTTSTDSSTTDSSTTDSSTTDSSTTDSSPCEQDEVCFPAVPLGWEGPIAAGPAGDCPAGHATPGPSYLADLVPGTPQCSCSCNIGAVSCQLHLENAGVDFNPVGSCDDPPFEDECLSAIVDATCLDTLTDTPATPTWDDGVSTCQGAVAGEACDRGGTCFANDDGFGSLCIRQNGDLTCPAGFDDRSLYYRDFTDTRTCSGCSCSPTGQACSIDVQICSVGFFDVTLTAGGGCEQLNSGDGDGVSLQSSVVSAAGTCQAGSGTGQISGDVVETGPVTLCCR